jgi:hypothetical protein
MSKHLDFPPQVRPSRKLRLNTPVLAKRMRDILVALGGEAHRGLVIEQVARSLGHDVRQIPEELHRQLILTFEEAWRDERRRAAYGFHLPFGEGSHRWGVRTVH